jgi:hypothetical protein
VSDYRDATCSFKTGPSSPLKEFSSIFLHQHSYPQEITKNCEEFAGHHSLGIITHITPLASPTQAFVPGAADRQGTEPRKRQFKRGIL